MDDAALLRRAWKGHEPAFCELFARYQRRIHQYASRMCGSAAAEDVVQDTFLAVLKPGGFDGSKGTVGAYLFGIARHHIIKRLAKRGAELIDPSDTWFVSEVAAQDTPLDSLAREQTIAAVREAVQSLPPRYCEVVVLCDLQEMDYATVADVIRCPIGTVRSRLHRARSLLAMKLAFVVSEREREQKHG